jgi:fatty-acyl-CoA synthase
MFDHPWPALEFAARTWPEAEALVFPHQNSRMSFRQYRDDALALAGALAARDINAGDHVALLAENRIEWAVVQMACAAIGAVFVPLNTHYRKDDLAYALKQSDSRVLICSTSYRSNPYLENVTALRKQLPLLEHVLTLEGDYPKLLRERHGFEPAAADPLRIASLLYTGR